MTHDFTEQLHVFEAMLAKIEESAETLKRAADALDDGVAALRRIARAIEDLDDDDKKKKKKPRRITVQEVERWR